MKSTWIIRMPSSGSLPSPSNKIPGTAACLHDLFTGKRSIKRARRGFTLLEVMIAVAIIAIACTAILGSQSQSVSLAGEAKFYTTATLLAQHKMSEIEIKTLSELMSDSGDFGEDFPGYSWRLDVQEPASVEPEGVSTHMKQVDLIVSWGEQGRYQYRLRYHGFFPSTR